jgi:N-dimethylarginine dimethylaminohydrolase
MCTPHNPFDEFGAGNAELTKKQQAEHAQLVQILQKYGVEIIQPIQIEDAESQVFTRDPCTVIGDKLFINNLGECWDKRDDEKLGLREIIAQLPKDKVVEVPKGIKLEGGNILLADDKVLVGQGINSSKTQAIEFLKKHLGDKFDVIPIYLTFDGAENFIQHLDMVLGLISDKHALAYTDGIREKSTAELQKHFQIIDVGAQEQTELATNVLCPQPGVVIAQTRHKRLASIMNSKGFRVETLDFTEILQNAGGIHCVTCPLERAE